MSAKKWITWPESAKKASVAGALSPELARQRGRGGLIEEKEFAEVENACKMLQCEMTLEYPEVETGEAAVAPGLVGETKFTMKFMTKITTTGTTTFLATVVWATYSTIDFLPACCPRVHRVLELGKTFQIAVLNYSVLWL